MQILNKIKRFYVYIFSKVIKGLKKVISWNRMFLNNIEKDFKNKKYFKSVSKYFIYILLLLTQIILAIVIILSYIACKLTGICLII